MNTYFKNSIEIGRIARTRTAPALTIGGISLPGCYFGDVVSVIIFSPKHLILVKLAKFQEQK